MVTYKQVLHVTQVVK